MAMEFFKKFAVVCSSDKIPTGEDDKYQKKLYLCTLFHLFLNFSIPNFVSGANSSGISSRISAGIHSDWNSDHKRC